MVKKLFSVIAAALSWIGMANAQLLEYNRPEVDMTGYPLVDSLLACFGD